MKMKPCVQETMPEDMSFYVASTLGVAAKTVLTNKDIALAKNTSEAQKQLPVMTGDYRNILLMLGKQTFIPRSVLEDDSKLFPPRGSKRVLEADGALYCVAMFDDTSEIVMDFYINSRSAVNKWLSELTKSRRSLKAYCFTTFKNYVWSGLIPHSYSSCRVTDLSPTEILYIDNLVNGSTVVPATYAKVRLTDIGSSHVVSIHTLAAKPSVSILDKLSPEAYALSLSDVIPIEDMFTMPLWELREKYGSIRIFHQDNSSCKFADISLSNLKNGEYLIIAHAMQECAAYADGDSVFLSPKYLLEGYEAYCGDAAGIYKFYGGSALEIPLSCSDDKTCIQKEILHCLTKEVFLPDPKNVLFVSESETSARNSDQKNFRVGVRFKCDMEEYFYVLRPDTRTVLEMVMLALKNLGATDIRLYPENHSVSASNTSLRYMDPRANLEAEYLLKPLQYLNIIAFLRAYYETNNMPLSRIITCTPDLNELCALMTLFLSRKDPLHMRVTVSPDVKVIWKNGHFACEGLDFSYGLDILEASGRNDFKAMPLACRTEMYCAFLSLLDVYSSNHDDVEADDIKGIYDENEAEIVSIRVMHNNLMNYYRVMHGNTTTEVSPERLALIAGRASVITEQTTREYLS